MSAGPSPSPADRDLLEEQTAYYRARAAEYDEWWFREGRYDRGLEHRARWLKEAEEVRARLRHFEPRGRVLDLACGTGLWTAELAKTAVQLTVVDASSEMLDLASARMGDSHSGDMRCVQADIFDWEPDALYDTVFFSFWLSHVPPALFEDFWELVRSALAPQGRVFFIDSLPAEESTASDHAPPVAEAIVQQRRLNDGRTFSIFKLFYEPDALASDLDRLGWRFEVSRTDTFFLYGSGSRSISP